MNNKGFTLVELAIVLVIIGLLVGGVITGKELIENARLIRFTSQVQAYSSSFITFQQKYDSSPGDFATARSRLRGCIASSFCYNGDNDGIIGAPSLDWSTDDQSGDNTLPAVETTMVWKHLLLADLITGVTVDADTTNPNWGETHPITELGGGFQVVYSSEDIAGYAVSSIRLVYRSSPRGNPHPAQGLGPVNPVFASIIDRKMDDGNAYTGRVISDQTGFSCFDNTGTYLPVEQKNCIMAFRITN